MLALGRLLRLSLAPSAVADVAAGLVLAAGAWPKGAGPWLGLLASACVYHGGMALNDWADREEDARLGRARPLPRGQISAGWALALGLGLLVLGPLLAAAVAPRAALVLGAVAILAVAYDLKGRGPWRGPLLLGACRAGNLTFGLFLGAEAAAASSSLAVPGFVVPGVAAYGAYVFLLSRLARLEDRRAPEVAAGRPALWLGLSALVLFGLGGVVLLGRGVDALASDGWWPLLAIVVAAWGAFGLVRVRPAGPWGPADAGRAAGAGLRRLLVATAALTLQSGAPVAPWVALAILAGYPVSFALRRVFPPT